MSETIKQAQMIQKKHGVSYYLATLLFPKRTKEATFSLYAFVRIIDDIIDVDQNLSHEEKLKTLKNFEKDFFNSFSQTHTSEHSIVKLFASTVKDYSIPKEYISAFFFAMRLDCIKGRYNTYSELEEYMYGSATVIGYCMCYIIGHKTDALPFARKLAEAMQLTNFIRDIKEDLVERDRIYIPREDMDSFNITENDFLHQANSLQFKNLIKFEIQRTRKLYKEAWEGINLLNKDGRLAVRCASNLYEAILSEIEKHDYDVFTKRHRLSLFKRIIILIKTILWNQRKL